MPSTAAASTRRPACPSQRSSATRDELALDIEPHWDLAYRTTFIGAEGRVLDVIDGVEPRFRLADAPSGYVRARVEDSDGLLAWVQPVFRA